MQQFQKLARNQWILPLTTPIMLIDHASIKNNAMFVKIFGEKVREKLKSFFGSLDLDLNSVMISKKTVVI